MNKYISYRHTQIITGWLAAIILCCGFSGCTESQLIDNDENDDLVYLNLSPTVVFGTSSRTAPIIIQGNGFPKSIRHNFGMWICRHDDTHQPYLDWMQNIQSTYNPAVIEQREAWIFHYQGTQHIRIGIKPADTVDIYAYYPYIQGVTDPRQIKFESGRYDLMRAKTYGVNAEPIDTAKNKAREVDVNLEFTHTLSCIQIDLVSDNPSMMTLNKIVLHDARRPNPQADEKNFLHRGGYMNIVTGEITHADSLRCDSIVLPNLATSISTDIEKSTISIMIPEVTGFEDDRFYITFTIDGLESPSKFFLPRNLVKDGNPITINGFETGKIYLYRLHISNDIRFEGVSLSDKWAGPVNIDIDI